KLLGENATLDEVAYKQTVDTLLQGGSDPVITKEPEGAFTHEVSKKAM
ncbi:MAG: ABC transporter substrate-binding protein, partial [Nitratireductor sp.]